MDSGSTHFMIFATLILLLIFIFVFSNKTVSDDVNKINIGKPVNKNEEKIIYSNPTDE